MHQNRNTSVLYSFGCHVLVLGALLATSRYAPHVLPMRLPGTPHGSRLLTYYSPGGAPARAATAPAPVKKRSSTPAPSIPLPVLTSHSAPVATAPSDPGTGTAGLSGLGQGDINIALQKSFPSPNPDLSSLPHGQKGDVVVNAVIDAQGNVQELTLLKSLTPAIDSSVLATVRQWTYTPATKDGQPVASEQELHFHFERA